MSNIKEIAKEVGISSASVSIYLNNRDTNRVSSKTKRKIDEAVVKLNYRKNQFASSLSSDKSYIIGVIIPTIMSLFQNAYTNTLLSGVQVKLSEHGYSLLFFPSSATSSIEIVKEQLENSAGCDGFLLFSTGFCSESQIRKNITALENTGKPFVTLNIPEVDEPVNQILIDGLNEAQGVEYLLKKGHEKILIILGRKGGEHTKQIEKHCKRMFEEYNLELPPDLIKFGNYCSDESRIITSEVLAEHNDITGVCCMSDLMASGSMCAIRKSGASIPEDISVIGRNNSEYSRVSVPALTTIDLHMQEAGLNAADLLLDILKRSGTSRKVKMKANLIERDSVAERRIRC
ncbi:MAG: LacI family DNA-binding transcriptional regulator [Spirochaetales bacterium]|nr:LacI family DNA-binding transcriptional regulator [Spirochaetales bacterium]